MNTQLLSFSYAVTTNPRFYPGIDPKHLDDATRYVANQVAAYIAARHPRAVVGKMMLDTRTAFEINDNAGFARVYVNDIEAYVSEEWDKWIATCQERFKPPLPVCYVWGTRNTRYIDHLDIPNPAVFMNKIGVSVQSFVENRGYRLQWSVLDYGTFSAVCEENPDLEDDVLAFIDEHLPEWAKNLNKI